MKSLRHALIRSFTFAFGLIWVLAFLLPKEIGGGIDRHGMYAPYLLGTRLYYTTAPRPSPTPLTEHPRGAYLVMMDLNRTNIRKQMFGLSPFRFHDYYGAKRPVVFPTDTGYGALYLGIGKDDRARVALAFSQDGTHWTPLPEPVFSPPQDVAPQGPTWFTAIDKGNRYELFYIVKVRGKGTLRWATSPNLREWTDRGVFLTLPEEESALAFVPLAEDSALLLSQAEEKNAVLTLVHHRNGRIEKRRLLMGNPEDAPTDVTRESPLLTLPFAQVIRDVQAVKDGEFLRVLIVGGNFSDPRLKIALLEGTNLNNLQRVPGSQSDGSLVELGSPGIPTYFDALAGSAAQFIPVVMTFGFGMGLISLLYLHGRKLAKREKNYGYSLVVLVGLVAMVGVQFGYRLTGEEKGPWAFWADLLFMKLQFPLGATMFGLLAAYLVSAAYRAFRIRTWEAGVLAAVAGLVILTQVPMVQFGLSLFTPSLAERGAYWDAQASHIRNWVLLVVNDAVQRAVGFGAFVGALAMALRSWLSLDKTEE
ncbi:MAG: hypothetical protein K6T17_01315 [Fimbriimonadales bacterium]|nr:hypothetical protein [Fimbriimonadales bacterium]